jgi:hypothetical protein
MITWWIFQIAVGCEDCKNWDYSRNDVIFNMFAGLLPQSGHELALQSTIWLLNLALKVFNTNYFLILFHYSLTLRH